MTSPAPNFGPISGPHAGAQPADNVFIERFWRTIKYEEIYLTGATSAPPGEGAACPRHSTCSFQCNGIYGIEWSSMVHLPSAAGTPIPQNTSEVYFKATPRVAG